MVKYNIETRMNAWCCPCGSGDTPSRGQVLSALECVRVVREHATCIGSMAFLTPQALGLLHSAGTTLLSDPHAGYAGLIP